MLSTLTILDTFALFGARWFDYAALAGMLALWGLLAAVLLGMYRVLRRKARGEDWWGDAPGA